MAELSLCEKKPKKAKKKKQQNIQQLSKLDNIPEEVFSTCSSQAILEICQNAAVTVLADSMLKAVQLNHLDEGLLLEQTESIKSLDESELKLNDDLKESGSPVPPEVLNGIDNFEQVTELTSSSNESKTEINPTSYDDALEDKNELESQPALPVLLTEKASLEHLSLAGSTTSVTQKSSEEDALGKDVLNDQVELSSKLKPSVFVGKGKLYSSSLQIGCNWDRTKYNIVLLPELNKVVYPDLDVLLYNKPSSDPFYSSHGHTSRQDNNLMPVDRSCKPRGHLSIKKTENSDDKPAQVNSACTFVIAPKNGTEIYKIDTRQDYRYTDCRVDGVDFRVFMNPIKWSPVENCQLVIYRVGPLYHEEFFVNCRTTDGLINAIKERAALSEQHQLTLAQTCLLTDAKDVHFFEIPNNSKATLVIYGCPTQWESDWHIIRFGVNDAFYQESLQGCRSFEDAVKIIKHRADLICKEQRILKAKAYSTTTARESFRIENVWQKSLHSSISDPMMNINNYDFEGEQLGPKDINEAHSSDINAVALTNHNAEQTQKANGLKSKFKSFRKWFKGTFSRKADKSGPLSEYNVPRPGRTLLKKNGWQWNDSPQVLQPTESTNVIPSTNEL